MADQRPQDLTPDQFIRTVMGRPPAPVDDAVPTDDAPADPAPVRPPPRTTTIPAVDMDAWLRERLIAARDGTHRNPTFY